MSFVSLSADWTAQNEQNLKFDYIVYHFKPPSETTHPKTDRNRASLCSLNKRGLSMSLAQAAELAGRKSPLCVAGTGVKPR
jgi:hypothetical protein